jgi:Cu(I)/Ag(I) efflux system periplasmic protein CusF
MNLPTAAALSLGVAVVAPFAIAEPSGPGAIAVTEVAGATAPMAQGEIKKVDKEAGKITIKHGPLANLEMPAMTMVFRVKDPAMLDQVKEGDKVKFVASRENGVITILHLEREN